MVVAEDLRLELIRSLSLPDGRQLRDTLPADPWLLDSVFTPILAKGEDGLPLHRVVYVELSRAHFKTGAAAGIAIAEALAADGTQVFVTASDLDQAGLLAEAVNGQLRRNPALAKLFTIKKNEFKVKRSTSKIVILSSDAPSAFGIGIEARRLRIICDELTQWPDDQLFHAMMSSLPKCRDSQLIVLSNAGTSPGSCWQWSAREAANTTGYLFSAPGVIASWITKADLQFQEASLPPLVYTRYWENEWTEEVDTFVPESWWDACYDDKLPPLDAKTPCVVGADAAVSGDSFALVAVSRDPERPRDSVVVRDALIWKPPRGGSIDFQGPWDYLKKFSQEHNVKQVTYDPFQLHDFMTRFMKENQVWCEEFQQQTDRLKADSSLYQLIRDKRLKHRGDPLLGEHVSNAGLKSGRWEDSKARLVKRGSGKIDATVAMSMAVNRCLYLNL